MSLASWSIRSDNATDAGARLGGRQRKRLAQGVEVHRQGRHALADIVVKLSGDSRSLGFVRIYQTSLDVLPAFRVVADETISRSYFIASARRSGGRRMLR